MADRHSHNSRLSARVTYVFPLFVQPSKIFPYYWCFENHLWLPFHQDPVAPFLFLLFYHLLQEVGRNIFDSHCLVVSVTFDPHAYPISRKDFLPRIVSPPLTIVAAFITRNKSYCGNYIKISRYFTFKKEQLSTIICRNTVGRFNRWKLW